MTKTRTTETLWFLNTRVEIAIAGDSNQDQLSVIRHWAPFGDSPPLHIHDTEDEVFHLFSGVMRFTVGGETVTIQAGDTIVAPKGVEHTFCVESPEGAHFMTVTSPGDFEKMVREVGRPAENDGLPEAKHPTEEEAAALGAICASHGIRLIGPPLEPRAAA